MPTLPSPLKKDQRTSLPDQRAVPLFDPSGLSTSIAAGDWPAFDLSSVAAARLGITSPPSSITSDAPPFGPLASKEKDRDRVPSKESESGPYKSPLTENASITDSTQSSPRGESKDGESHAEAERRGRRRRSSAFNESPEVRKSTVQSSVGSKVRMWWERSAASSSGEDDDTHQEEGGETAASGVASSSSSSLQAAKSTGGGRPSLSLSPCFPAQVATERLEASSEAGAEVPSTPPRPNALAETPASGRTIAMSESQTESPTGSLSPSVRSPAADFLSAFSSMNSVVAADKWGSTSMFTFGGSGRSHAVEPRSTSYSPPRSEYQDSLSASVGALDPEERAATSIESPGHWRGFGSAAAQLYGGVEVGRAVEPTRPDDEGARVGPSGRYLLGKAIGFGGFSTVREGWDLGDELEAAKIEGTSSGLKAPERRRVAVKIVYPAENAEKTRRPVVSSELDIWRTLPAHPHLLPLLHFQRTSLAPGNGATTSSDVEILVMPYCDRGNLLDFVRSEGGRRTEVARGIWESRVGSSSPTVQSESGSPLKSSLSRSTSLRDSVLGHQMATSQPTTGRTGSGFIHHPSRGNRIVSASVAMRPPHLRSAHPPVTPSASTSPGTLSNGSLSRRTSGKAARSQGVSIHAARETLRQLASGLFTLHKRAKILHGDIKLENILGQRVGGGLGARRRVDSESSDNDGSAFPSKSGPAVVLDEDEPMPCWRIADFGLAQKVDTAQSGSLGAFEDNASGQEATTGTRKTRSPISPLERGGSLAYAAPEMLRTSPLGLLSAAETAADAEVADRSESSPFAADMWALGCILYALLSGRLPFVDSFEPRLQMKIAKAKWDLPPRLQRRAERLAAATTGQSSFGHARERSSSISLNSHMGRGFGRDRHGSMSSTGTEGFSQIDMSASLPSLPPNDRPLSMLQLYGPPTTTHPPPHSELVVGSAPGRANQVAQALEINDQAKALADAEVDPESDGEENTDADWNGCSWDRAAARQVLHGLLEPNPAKRWTIEELCSSAWLKDEMADLIGKSISSAATTLNKWGRERRTASAETSMTSGFDELKPDLSEVAAAAGNRRPSLASQTIAERRSQEAVQTLMDFRKRDPSAERGGGAGSSKRSSSLARLRPTEPVGEIGAGNQFKAAGAATRQERESGSIDGEPAEEGSRRARGCGAGDQDAMSRRTSGHDRSRSLGRISTDGACSNTSSGAPSPFGAANTNTPTIPTSLWGHSRTGRLSNPSADPRSESPAESETRGRAGRPRMADLDEENAWTGTSEDDPNGSGRRGREGNVAARPIPIREGSGSRSRSRTSLESSSPEPSIYSSSHRAEGRRISTTNPLLDHQAITRGRGRESWRDSRSGSTRTSSVEAVDRTQVVRSSTSRSRSRAPDALAHILGLDRERE
ncbi:kinase-like protein [Violaceomyces palustris]|uniref:Kinase-like protein n=1 Tax=Violaceomyces palustris TaxID=1673888 RepID=A0ACD0NW82_9BASI|nr:kinase-like protein [Violaceomyces palustris]